MKVKVCLPALNASGKISDAMNFSCAEKLINKAKFPRRPYYISFIDFIYFTVVLITICKCDYSFNDHNYTYQDLQLLIPF